MQHALILEYDGSHFAGFQLQNDKVTVQGVLEEAIAIVLREKVRVHCSGRTDAGVHATNQVASFQHENPILHTKKFMLSLNALIPDAVSVLSIFPVPAAFHPRFSCLAREYEYFFYQSQARPVHWRNKAMHLKEPLKNLQALQDELSCLIGEHDFASFTRAEYREESTIRYIDFISLEPIPDTLCSSSSIISFRIRGNAFLHNMIRILAGCIVDRSRGKIDSFKEILNSRDRTRGGQTAPPYGLYFRKAYYPAGLADGLSTLSNYPNFRK